MDFRELINKIDSINSEAKKEPERLAFDDAINHVKDIKFTPPTASGAKFSIANNPKFKGQNVNDQEVKLAILQDALKNFPAMLFGEMAQRIKPTTDAQIELSQFVGDISNKMDPEGSHIGQLSKPERELAIAVTKAALRGMELERDPDQSTYNDDDAEDANEMESSLPWKKFETPVKEGQYDGKSRDELMKMKARAEADIKNMQSSGDGPQEKFYDETQMMMAQRHLDDINDALKKMGEGIDPTTNEGDNIYHSCVKSFKHAKFGEGEVLHGEHTLSESGEVSHYDAKFVREDGSQFIVRNIPVANMKECVVVEHGHPKKKKKVKEEEVELEESPMVTFTVPNVTSDMASKLERIAKEKKIEYSRQGRTVVLKGKRIDMTMLRTKMGLAQTNIPMVPVNEEVVDEAHYQDYKEKIIPVNKDVELAGDSIWDKEGTNPKSVNVKEIHVTFEIDTESDDPEDRDITYVAVQVEHDGPWTIYTDTGFERAISQMIGIDVEFTEQGMQDDGEASLEGSVATKDIPADAKPLESIKQEETVEDDSGKDRDSVKPEMVKGVAEKIKAEYVDELRTYMDRKKDVVQQLKSSGITDPKEIEQEINDMDDDILSYYYPGDIKGKIEVMNSVLNLGPDADGHDIVDMVHNSGMDTSPREEIADQFQNELKKADPETFKKLYGNKQTISDVESVEQEDWFQGQNDVTLNGDEFYETFGWIGENDENIEEAEYQGRTVKLNKPMRGDVKKFKVYVNNPKGNVVKVNFGDPDMKIKKSNPARRKSFRARHNCDTPGPKHKARYWSCRKW